MRVRRHRAEFRGRGLRPMQIWVLDNPAPRLAEECRLRSLLLRASERRESRAEDERLVRGVGQGRLDEDSAMLVVNRALVTYLGLA